MEKESFGVNIWKKGDRDAFFLSMRGRNADEMAAHISLAIPDAQIKMLRWIVKYPAELGMTLQDVFEAACRAHNSRLINGQLVDVGSYRFIRKLTMGHFGSLQQDEPNIGVTPPLNLFEGLKEGIRHGPFVVMRLIYRQLYITRAQFEQLRVLAETEDRTDVLEFLLHEFEQDLDLDTIIQYFNMAPWAVHPGISRVYLLQPQWTEEALRDQFDRVYRFRIYKLLDVFFSIFKEEDVDYKQVVDDFTATSTLDASDIRFLLRSVHIPFNEKRRVLRKILKFEADYYNPLLTEADVRVVITPVRLRDCVLILFDNPEEAGINQIKAGHFRKHFRYWDTEVVEAFFAHPDLLHESITPALIRELRDQLTPTEEFFYEDVFTKFIREQERREEEVEGGERRPKFSKERISELLYSK